MSRDPAIGVRAMDDVASVMMQYRLEMRGDVPLVLDHGRNSHWPLGRKLRNELRKRVGLPEGAPDSALQEAANKLLILRWAARNMDTTPRLICEEVNSPYAARIGVRDIIRGRTL